MNFANVEVFGFDASLRGMRNPMNSWDKSDSGYDYHGKFYLGENDLKLAQKLILAGNEHRKFMRQIMISVDITAPLYWWKEFDTYKVGTTANSTSTMHFAHKRDFNLEDFSIDCDIIETKSDKLQKDVSILVEKEEWRDVVGYEGLYKVSNSGKILRLPYQMTDEEGNARNYKGGIISTPINSSGYKKCVLRKEGVGKNYYLHRIMAISFIENNLNLPVVNHKDGNKLNCNLSNLEWCTHSENDLHAIKIGTKSVSNYNKIKVGEKARMFSDEDVSIIFDMFENGMSKKEISEIFDCYDSTICNILNGKTYKSVEVDELTSIKLMIDELNYYRQLYISTKDKKYWRKMIQLIPSSYLQTRTITMSYENVRSMYFQRRNHKLSEWSKSFIKWVESLPYARELIMLEKGDK